MKRAPIEKPTQRELLSAKIDRTSTAIADALNALSELSLEERIQTIRWICDFYGIARVALYQGVADASFKEQS